jgi:hypothetical protein
MSRRQSGPWDSGIFTQVLFPSGWAWRITIGRNYDPTGSKVEVSYSPSNYVLDVDVSYVDGYTISISCSCSGVAVTGCNIRKSALLRPPSPISQNLPTERTDPSPALFHDGHTCANQGSGPFCYNPEQDIPEGPASPFFPPLPRCRLHLSRR